MGILHDKRSPFDFPPGTPMGQEERDRFGLPMQGGASSAKTSANSMSAWRRRKRSSETRLRL
jgi:hypothetical protein